MECANHLGNVLAVVSDKKEQTDGAVWSAVVVSVQDYYPFGMAMPGRSTDAKHRYTFNGKETDPETGIQDYGMRWYLPSIGRFPSVDPLTKKFPELTPYQFASNTPIWASDLDGAEANYTTGQLSYNLNFNFAGSNYTPAQQQAYMTAFTTNLATVYQGLNLSNGQTVNLNGTANNITGQTNVAANPNGNRTLTVNVNNNVAVANASGNVINMRAQDFNFTTNQVGGVGGVNTPAHEFGHCWGLQDRYVDGNNFGDGSTNLGRFYMIFLEMLGNVKQK